LIIIYHHLSSSSSSFIIIIYHRSFLQALKPSSPHHIIGSSRNPDAVVSVPGFSVVMSDWMHVTPGMGLMGASVSQFS
jgi:hypothetical protein